MFVCSDGMMLRLFCRLLSVVTTGGIISGIDNVRLMGDDLEVAMDPDTDPDCGVIGAISVINSVVILRASWLAQEVAVERVTKHPPGSTNFAIGIFSLLTATTFSRTVSPSCSLMIFVVDWSSSELASMKLANDVIGTTEGVIWPFVLEFADDFVSGTVSNSFSPVIDPPALTLRLPLVIPLAFLLLGNNNVGIGRMSIVSLQSLFFERFEVDESVPATKEKTCPFSFSLSDENRLGIAERKTL